MEAIAGKYTQENAEKRLQEIYQGYLDARVALFQSALLTPQPPTTPTAEITTTVENNTITQ
jgi:hypothetical protein